MSNSNDIVFNLLLISYYERFEENKLYQLCFYVFV